MLTFAPHLAKLGYGVMVTLQILVLSFMVRVHIPQLRGECRLPSDFGLGGRLFYAPVLFFTNFSRFFFVIPKISCYFARNLESMDVKQFIGQSDWHIII